MAYADEIQKERFVVTTERMVDKTKKEKVFVSWSGGKDCCLACHKALKKGLDVCYLVSMITRDRGRLWPHYLTPDILLKQAEAIGIPMRQEWANVSDYDRVYKDMLLKLKREGITGAVFGDVNSGNELKNKHLRWIESVCKPVGTEAYLPLWSESRQSLFEEFISCGFEAIIIITDVVLGKEYLGRKLDNNLLEEFKIKNKKSPTGGVGYYHTFVTNGPIFRRRLEIKEAREVLETDKRLVADYWYLDIRSCELKSK